MRMTTPRSSSCRSGRRGPLPLAPSAAWRTCNPATAAFAGYRVENIPANEAGRVDLEALKARLGPDVAAVMITNPNTCGLFEPEMKAMAAEIVGAVKLIDEALPLLRQITRSGNRLHELTGRIVAMEGAVDVIHETGLKANFARARQTGDTVQFIVAREIFKHLEKISDAFEDVANSLDGLAVDHA